MSSIEAVTANQKSPQKENPEIKEQPEIEITIENSNEFYLTPIQGLLLNRLIPAGYKLETEEILQKQSQENAKCHNHKRKRKPMAENDDYPRYKRQATTYSTKAEKVSNNTISNNNTTDNSNNINISNQNNNQERKSLRQHKPNVIEDLGYIDKDVLKAKSNPIRVIVSKQCEKGFATIKKHPWASLFFSPVISNVPSLATIEKNIKNYKYKTIHEFILDLRKLWNYYFLNYSTKADLYQKTCEMSILSEQMSKDLEILYGENEIIEINKKIDSMTKVLNDIKGINNHGSPNNFSNTKKYNDKGLNNFGQNYEKPLTINEKNNLKNNIGLLSIEEMKGIVNILSDTIDIANKTVLEFDIEKLNTKKLRELDRYVKNCLKKDRRHNHTNNSNSNNLINSNSNSNAITTNNNLSANDSYQFKSQLNKNSDNDLEKKGQGNNQFNNIDDIDSISSSESDSISLSSLE